jgi:hypothetical protein
MNRSASSMLVCSGRIDPLLLRIKAFRAFSPPPQGARGNHSNALYPARRGGTGHELHGPCQPEHPALAEPLRDVIVDDRQGGTGDAGVESRFLTRQYQFGSPFLLFIEFFFGFLLVFILALFLTFRPVFFAALVSHYHAPCCRY